MEHSPIGTALVGLDGSWLWTNITICEILGYTHDELEQLSFQQITHPDDLQADLDLLQNLIAGEGSAYQMEKRYFRKDGKTVWCLLAVSIVRTSDGAPDYFISTIQDISQRKESERERAALTDRLTLATQGIGIGVWEWDVVSNEIVWDARMFELYGLEPTITADYHTFIGAVDPAQREGIAALLKAALAGTAEFDTEFTIILPDGQVRQARGMATVTRDAAGRAVRMVGTNWDVSEIRRLVEASEQSARSKSEFLATISHELRTPLNSIIGFSRLVLEASLPGAAEQLPPTAQRHIQLVNDASTTLLTIVNDVLDFSRIEAGGFDLTPAPFELRTMVENVVEIVRASAEAKGLALHLSLAPDLPRLVVGDQCRLRQILLNLIGNAIKFTAAGHVAVTIATDDGGGLQWEVRDTGIGIAIEQQHLLFKRFSQVDQSIARRFGGSGLGLAICERLISAMGGRIGVDSDEGAGSRFWFSTPLVIAAACPANGTASAEFRSAATVSEPRRILLAEDVEMNQLLAVAMLQKLGHEVVVVANGAEAVARIQREWFDIVLMDVQMPIMDGIEATRQIRALGGRLAQVPIVAVTANVMSDEIARFRQCGMSDHIGKPIAVNAFASVLQRWCPAEVASARTAVRR